MTVYDKKSRLVVYKGGKCFDCGRIFPQCCYDFDHRDPNQKSFGISQRMGLPLEELMIEADKCDLVCSNCHRIRTAGNPAISQKITKAQQGRPAWNRRKKCPQISRNMQGNSNGQGNAGIVRNQAQKDKISETLKARGIRPSVAACSKGGKTSQGTI